MKCTTIIDNEREEEVIIYAHARTPLTEKIEGLVNETQVRLLGYAELDIVKISPSDVNCFVTEDDKLYALTEKEKLRVKLRLYEVEEMLDENFVKINQSCIANIHKIKRFTVSIGAALRVEFDNGYKDYVSRRQLKSVKERLGLK